MADTGQNLHTSGCPLAANDEGDLDVCTCRGPLSHQMAATPHNSHSTGDEDIQESQGLGMPNTASEAEADPSHDPSSEWGEEEWALWDMENERSYYEEVADFDNGYNQVIEILRGIQTKNDRKKISGQRNETTAANNGTAGSDRAEGLISEILQSVGRYPKLPDPPKLDDGKEFRFAVWAGHVRSNLRGNANLYPGPIQRKNYVQSLCKGRARLVIAPRMKRGSTDQYSDAEDMLAHLQSVFAPPESDAT